MRKPEADAWTLLKISLKMSSALGTTLALVMLYVATRRPRLGVPKTSVPIWEHQHEDSGIKTP